MSFPVLFLRRGFSGTCTCSTCDTRFCVLVEGGAERRVTGVTSGLVARLSLKFLDTETKAQGCSKGHQIQLSFIVSASLDLN